MNVKSFIQSAEYQEFKAFIMAQMVDKPIEVKTDGKSAEVIALEYKACELAGKKILKAIKRFERLVPKEIKPAIPFR